MGDWEETVGAGGGERTGVGSAGSGSAGGAGSAGGGKRAGAADGGERGCASAAAGERAGGSECVGAGGGERAHGDRIVVGEVVKLDRGYPLVRLADGEMLRCEHATTLVKEGQERAVIGDVVDVRLPDTHDKALIERIHERSRVLVRKDPTERALPQVLAANFDRVVVVQPLCEVNVRRMERELVLAHETGADVTVVLTKADLAEGGPQVEDVRAQVQALVGSEVDVLVVSTDDPASVEAVRSLMPVGTTTVLIGRSGVGKSSLVNLLTGHEVRQTARVREGDGKGRHTTVNRAIVEIPGAGRVVDMPGVRGLGLWDADDGIGAAFSDIEEIAASCRFRDCKHESEPGCAVRAALQAGAIAPERYESYQALRQETAAVKERREQARWMQKDRGYKPRAKTKPKAKTRRKR